MSFINSIKSFFFPSEQQRVGTLKSAGSSVAPSNFMKHYKDLENIDGSFKKGGSVKKTGNYKLHKGEYVLNPRMVALIKSGEGPKKKGYEQTFKTVPKKKYDWDKSQNYREKTGYYRTKVDGGGHDAGYKWAMKQFENGEIEPTTRKRKWGANSPSFDEGFREARMRALKGKSK